MSNSKHGKGRTKLVGQFAPRTIDMVRSPAMHALSLTGRRILDRLEIELADHGGVDNGRLPVTYDDFEKFGIHRHAIGPGLREVEALGFVETTERGVAGNAEYRSPSLYRLTYRHTSNTAPTDEWRRHETIEGAEAIARAARTSKPARQWSTARQKINIIGKTNSSGGKRQISVSETATKNQQIHSAETATTVSVSETTTTIDISGPPPQTCPPENPSPNNFAQAHLAKLPWSTPTVIELPADEAARVRAHIAANPSEWAVIVGEPLTRGRGRPKGSKDKPRAPGAPRRGRPKGSKDRPRPPGAPRRGRPPGSKNKPKAAA